MNGFVEKRHGFFDQILRIDVRIEQDHLRRDVQVNVDLVVRFGCSLMLLATTTRRLATILDHVQMFEERVEAA